MKNLIIEIDVNGDYCQTEKEKCRYLGVTSKEKVCGLFPPKKFATLKKCIPYTVLEIEGGNILRCLDCMESQGITIKDEL